MAAAAHAARRPLVPNGVMGMVMFVFAETMLFAGLISAFMIVRSVAPGGVWPPPGQPRLPVETTALNTAALVMSGIFLHYAHRELRWDVGRALKPLTISLALGAFFLLFQGFEWARLLGQGLTLTSSAHGGFFYLIVGAHALHAIGALALLGRAWARLRSGRLDPEQLWTAEVLWYFVVCMWPIIYVKVYL